MAKPRTRFVCQSCGAVAPRWAGRCDGCGDWNTIFEELEGPPDRQSRSARSVEFVNLASLPTEPRRLLTGIGEFDRVTGGGIVPGGVILIGGDPGIGKSTLVLQICANLAAGVGAAYFSGEEGPIQIQHRAARLERKDAAVMLAAETDVGAIAAAIDRTGGPRIAVIDSIQTMHHPILESAPGTVGQIRAAAQAIISAAKRRDCAVIMVGHVTKDGSLAGPRVLEHMVDCVLYFEGDRGDQFRILRSIKNRFGATHEIGVFEMTGAGLAEVGNPSALFLANRRADTSGSIVFAGLEGTRPMLVEIQALVAPSPLGTPRRAVVGWDPSRLAMVLAVLEARCGVRTGTNDIYLNVAGGLRITETGADLAVAAAICSAVSGVPLPEDMAVFGEVGLAGEIRPVSQPDARVREAAKLGYGQIVLAKSGQETLRPSGTSRLIAVDTVMELLRLFERS